MKTVEELVRSKMPQGWDDRLVEGATTTLGYDVATTTNALSNPSALAVMQQVGRDRVVRLLLRWKAEEAVVSHAVLDAVLADMAAAGVRPRCLGIDATSEKYFATEVRRRLRGTVPVELCVFSQNVEIGGEKMTMKAAGCSQYVARFEDNAIALPNADWIYADHRLVKDKRGGFEFEEDSAGNHADGFSACMLADYVMERKTGRAEVATATGGKSDAREASDFDETGNALAF